MINHIEPKIKEPDSHDGITINIPGVGDCVYTGD